MVVKAVVNHGTRAPDKLYDYLVPEEFEDKIQTGTRIKVPFGVHNTEVEAYVFDVKVRSKAQKLKSVSAVYDRAFDEKMLSLIEWLRDECVCTYLDVIKTVVPCGSVNKPEEWLEVIKESDDEIVAKIKENGGACELNALLSRFDTDVTKRINKLVNDGILSRNYRDKTSVKAKTVRVARLNANEDEVSQVLEVLQKSKATSQQRIIEILESCDFVSLADLVSFSDSSYGAIRALEKKGYITCFDVEIMRKGYKSAVTDTKKTLTDEQQIAFDTISKDIKNGEFSELLLHGVTGSGKTEVYMQAIEETIENGKKAIMLVPEISLTPQTIARFTARFGERIAVLHSKLSLGERYDEWRRIRDNKADIVIGARSAVFAPMDNIGIIIIDEEHEQSYKSEMQPRYDTVKTARFRAKQYNAVLLLASATPKTEDYYRAKTGKIKLLTISKRVNASNLPDVKTVDMRGELSRGNRSVLSVALQNEIAKNLENGEQTILFLNRRGFSTFVSCRKCGYVCECPNCSISLTYHKYNDTLRCHYCGYSIKNPTVCPECGSKYIRYFGGGTQKVEEEVGRLFPTASVIRMDVDTTKGKNGHERILSEFEKNKTDILIGTQMVAKGLDFENVTLVGVISADTALNVDDYRADERTFSLLEQVCGRAGRAEKKGRAIIQTYSPQAPAVAFASKHDYQSFYELDIKTRRAMNYPPFCQITVVFFSGENQASVSACAKHFARCFAEIEKVKRNAKLIGPIPSAISKIKNKYRWQLIIKSAVGVNLTDSLASVTQLCRKNKNYDTVTIISDKNPNSIY